MSKKIALTLIFSLLIMCICPVTYAQGKVADILAGKQDYLLLATVVDFDDSSIIVAPYHVIHTEGDGENEPSLNSNISIEKFRYSYCHEHSDITTSPKAGDNIFISINENGSGYSMANGAYKISSVDYKLLTFYASESMKDSDCLAEIVALAYFVRTDGSMRDFHFENDKLTTYIDGKTLTLYPTENLTETITFLNIQGKVMDNVKTKDVIIDGEEPMEESEDYRWIIAYGIIILGVLVGGIVVYNATAMDILNRKRDRKETN